MTAVVYSLITFLGLMNILIFSVFFSGISLARIKSYFKRKKDNAEPVYVVIPAKNEEHNLPDLFKALEKQDYRGEFSIVLINDNSSDNTESLMRSWVKGYGGKAQILVTPDEYRPIKNPKQRALSYAMENISHGYILLTDADCKPPSGWISSMTERLSVSGTGLVSGPVKVVHKAGFLNAFQNYDHIFRFGFTAASSGLGSPTGGFGNNLGIRKCVLDEIGGFESLEYSATEDAVLISTVRKKTDWDVISLPHEKYATITGDQICLGDLVKQEIRWNTGGMKSSDLLSSVSYSLIMFHVFLSLLVLSIPMLPLPLKLSALVTPLNMTVICMFAGFITGIRSWRFWLTLPLCTLCAMILYSFVTVKTVAGSKVIWKKEVLGEI